MRRRRLQRQNLLTLYSGRNRKRKQKIRLWCRCRYHTSSCRERWQNTTEVQTNSKCVDAIRKRVAGCYYTSLLQAVRVEYEQWRDLHRLILTLGMATRCGTCNFGGDEIFIAWNMISNFAKEKMNERNVKPEIVVFDKGMVDIAIRLHKSRAL